MAIKTSCPKCLAAYNLAERQLGKKIRCKQCDEAFVVVEQVGPSSHSPAAAPARSGFASSPGDAPRARDEDDSPAPRRRDDDDDRSSRRSREDYHDEDIYKRARSRHDDQMAPPRSKKGLIIFAIIGFVLLAGGGVTAIILLNKKDDKEDDAKKPGINSVADAVKGLKSGDPEKRREAARWLAETKPDISKWGEVQGPLMNAALDGDRMTRDHANRALKAWADAQFEAIARDQFNRDRVGRDVPRRDGGIPVQPPEDIATAPVEKLLEWCAPQNPNRERAIRELGRRKEVRGAKAIAQFLAQFFERQAAFDALRDIGAAAENEVLPYINHPETDARYKARELLRLYGTKVDKAVTQTIDDLNSNDVNRSKAALEWLERMKPQLGARQSDVCRAIEKLLNDPDAGLKDAAIKALGAFATAENVPAIAAALDTHHDKGGHDDYFRSSMDLLARLKDPRGAGAIARFLNHVFVGDSAERALGNMGPVAQPEVLKFIFDPTHGAHKRAKTLLVVYGTKDDAILDQAVADLRGREKERRKMAAEWLADDRFLKTDRDAATNLSFLQQGVCLVVRLADPKRNIVATALNLALQDSDRGVQDAAMMALKAWGTKVNVQPLVSIIDSNEFIHHSEQARSSAMLALAATRDERAVIPLVAKLRSPFDSKGASLAVKEMGTMAEPIVANLLINEGNHQTQAECCRILGVIGTKQSMQLLRTLTLQHRDLNVRQAAAEALNAIQKRT